MPVASRTIPGTRRPTYMYLSDVTLNPNPSRCMKILWCLDPYICICEYIIVLVLISWRCVDNILIDVHVRSGREGVSRNVFSARNMLCDAKATSLR
jgi:hypothetical protein